MFLSKEQKETRRQRKAREAELRTHLRQRRDHLKERQVSFGLAVESYRQAVSEKWQYLSVSDKNMKDREFLDEIGSMGWELVGVSTYPEERAPHNFVYHTLYAFKRRVPETPRDLLVQFGDIEEIKSEIRQVNSELAELGK